jgi:hypothetical protein
MTVWITRDGQPFLTMFGVHEFVAPSWNMLCVVNEHEAHAFERDQFVPSGHRYGFTIEPDAPAPVLVRSAQVFISSAVRVQPHGWRLDSAFDVTLWTTEGYMENTYRVRGTVADALDFVARQLSERTATISINRVPE